MNLLEIKSIVRKSSSHGQLTLNNNTELFGRVPHIAPQAWLHAIYPPLHLEEIILIESELGLKIPSAYKEFLSEMNGLTLFSGSLDLFGYRRIEGRTFEAAYQPFNLIKLNREERLKDTPEGYFFIGFYNWDGSLLYLDGNEVVHRCSSSSFKSINSWLTFEIFIDSEVKRLSLMFDKAGKEINLDEPTTPLVRAGNRK